MKKVVVVGLVVVIVVVVFGVMFNGGDESSSTGNVDRDGIDGVAENVGNVEEELIGRDEEDIVQDDERDDVEISKEVENENIEEVVVPQLINGKGLEERVLEAYSNLHGENSEQQIRDDFPDIELVFSDDGVGEGYPSEILPFDYYYSAEADKTFNICAVERTIFICNGKMDRKVTTEELDDISKCSVTPIYKF